MLRKALIIVFSILPTNNEGTGSSLPDEREIAVTIIFIEGSEGIRITDGLAVYYG